MSRRRRMKDFNLCKNYTTQINGLQLPKYALYGYLRTRIKIADSYYFSGYWVIRRKEYINQRHKAGFEYSVVEVFLYDERKDRWNKVYLYRLHKFFDVLKELGLTEKAWNLPTEENTMHGLHNMALHADKTYRYVKTYPIKKMSKGESRRRHSEQEKNLGITITRQG